jgi:hypothetical protein
MGWGYGINGEGREVGYTVESICDQDGCEKQIHRGLAYVCGAMHDGGEHGCGEYFCYDHLTYATLDPVTLSGQVCFACADRLEMPTGPAKAADARAAKNPPASGESDR